MVVAAADPTVVVVVVAADPMVVVAEDRRASARPGPRNRPPLPHQQSSDASRGVRDKRPIGVASLPPTLRCHMGRRNYLQPFAIVQGARGRDGGAGSHSRGAGRHDGGAGSHAGRLGASGRCIGVLDPTVGVPAAGLVNRHAALIEGRQRGQDLRPQPWIVAERRDALGEDQRLKNE
jgi:hypothetical protein